MSNTLDGYSFSFDPVSPDGDYAALTIRNGDKFYSLIGDELQAFLQWVADEVEKAEPGTYTSIEGTDDPEWRGYVKGVQDYKDNVTAILKQHGWKEGE